MGSQGMGADYRGTFVIPAVRCEIDGIAGAPARAIAVGSVWRWHGGATRIDGPQDILLLDSGMARALRARAADHAARLLGATARRSGPALGDAALRPGTLGFTVTDGLISAEIGVVTGAEGEELLVVAGALPPSDTDLFVTAVESDPAAAAEPAAPRGMICFTPGTLIATSDGPRPVETIRPGDRVQTRDGEPEEVLWTGSRRLTGARLYALPALRPVRIRAGALAPAPGVRPRLGMLGTRKRRAPSECRFDVADESSFFFVFSPLDSALWLL